MPRKTWYGNGRIWDFSLAAADTVPPDVRLQARALGASAVQAVLLQLREIRGSLVAAVAAGFGAIISEVGAVMIVGGIAMGIVLMAVALYVNVLLLLLGRRSARRLSPT